jgi:hypothetical protein
VIAVFVGLSVRGDSGGGVVKECNKSEMWGSGRILGRILGKLLDKMGKYEGI